MAFDPQDLKIIPKGLNLLPPGDQVAEGDCLELTGWWPGSAGRLQQARGWIARNGTQALNAGVPVPLDTLMECNGRIYYGGGGFLYMIGASRGGPGEQIDSGYDGNPLGVAAFQGFCWVMNRSKQTRDNGTSIVPWGVEQPGSPSTSTLSGGGLADGIYEYYVTFVDTAGYEGDPCAAASEANVPPGAFDTGTVAVEENSTSVVLSGGTWTSGITGQQFAVQGDYADNTQTPYTITYVDATHGTLNIPYEGASNSAANFLIFSPANSSAVTVTRPNAVTPALISGWNIYRLSPGAGSIYRVPAPPGVSTNADGSIVYATSSVTDYGDQAHGQDQETLIQNDEVMEDDHDPAPAASVMADKPYNGRLVVANSAAHPNRVWWTDPLQPHYFPGSGNPQVGNWADIGDDTGDGVLRIVVRVGQIIIYRQKSIWQITGDLGDSASVIAPLIPNMGIVGPRASVATSNGDLALVKQGNEYGLYRVTDWEQRVSQKVEPILNGLGSECYLPLSTAEASTCALGFQLGRLWLSYADGSNVTPNRVLLCDVEQDTFNFTVAGRWFSRYAQFGCYLHSVNYFLAAGLGWVYSLEDGVTGENGAKTQLAYQSAYVDCGNPDHEKTWADLVLSHNTGGETWTITVRTNKGAAAAAGDSFTLATISSTQLTRQVIPLEYPVGHANAGKPIESFSLAVRITGTGPLAYPGAILDGPILLHYFLKPRKAMSWDSGPTDHGMPNPKLIDIVEIDVDAPAGVRLFIQSDIPGGQLVERTLGGAGILTATTSGRQVMHVVSQTPATGRILRYQIYSGDGATPFLLYRVRVRALPIGVYLDGSFGDNWYTEPLAVAA